VHKQSQAGVSTPENPAESKFLDSIIVEPGKQTRWVLGPKSAKGKRTKMLSGKKAFFGAIGRNPLTQTSYENITQALNELKHEVLSHQLFLSCFSSAVRRGEIKGLTKSSLFRMTLAYFLLVPDAKEKFLSELEKQLKKMKT